MAGFQVITEVPDSFAAVLLGLSLVFLLSPYLSGADFGFFKIPSFSQLANKRFKIAGPLIMLFVLSLFIPVMPKEAPADSKSMPKTKDLRPQRVYDLGAEFSDSTNPSGSWTYGFFEGVPEGAELHLYGRGADPVPGLVAWTKPTWPWPNVTCNLSDHPISVGQPIWEPRQVVLHPGNGGLFSVVRWAAMMTGTYRIDAEFAGNNPKPTTSDVYIIKKGEVVYKREISGFRTAQVFSEFLFCSAGDTLDFVVGPGPDKDFGGDDTTLKLKITLVS